MNLGRGAGTLSVMGKATVSHQPYPTNFSDADWAFVAPYLTLMTPDAPQRQHDLREVVNRTFRDDRWNPEDRRTWDKTPGWGAT